MHMQTNTWVRQAKAGLPYKVGREYSRTEKQHAPSFQGSKEEENIWSWKKKSNSLECRVGDRLSRDEAGRTVARLQHLKCTHSGSAVKNPHARQVTRVRLPGWEEPLKTEMATRSSILAWRIAGTEEPGVLRSLGSQESDSTEWLNHWNKRGSD